MSVFSLCVLLCADLLDLAVGKCEPPSSGSPHPNSSPTIQRPPSWGAGVTMEALTGHYRTAGWRRGCAPLRANFDSCLLSSRVEARVEARAGGLGRLPEARLEGLLVAGLVMSSVFIPLPC